MSMSPAPRRSGPPVGAASGGAPATWPDPLDVRPVAADAVVGACEAAVVGDAAAVVGEVAVVVGGPAAAVVGATLVDVAGAALVDVAGSVVGLIEDAAWLCLGWWTAIAPTSTPSMTKAARLNSTRRVRREEGMGGGSVWAETT